MDGRPGVACDDGNTAKGLKAGGRWRALEFHHAFDTGHGQRRCVVEGGDTASVNRRTRDYRVLHARQPGIDAVTGSASRHIVKIDDRQALADIAELRAFLQLQRFRLGHRQRTRDCGDLTVSENTPGWGVNDLVIARVNLSHVDAPRGRRRRLEHLAHRRAHLTHGQQKVAHAAGAIRVLPAVGGFVTGSL